jgi:hypothetical protein|tara:strand:+ start:690 stop:956 length:267 start_codon:yes stop_codon:yes gene_type:complete
MLLYVYKEKQRRKMTKKDYIKFVGVWKKSIRFMGNDTRGYHYIDADSLYQAMCDIFEEDNPRFDEQRFRDAVERVIWEEEKEQRKLAI